MKSSLKPLPANHQVWHPYPYQARAEKFLMENGAAALFLDPGLGKTSVVLSAFSKLLEKGVASKMLVIAPLRVCQLVWRQEAEQWTQFRHLKFAFIHGTKKEEALRSDADVYLINPEGVSWLAKKFPNNAQLPFDTVVIDELTKFKNAQSQRFKKLRPRIKTARRRWGLTGTPAPNGLLDLFGQILLLDDGRTFGRWITHFRDKYFVPDFMGYNYTLQPGAEKRIQDKLEPIALRMKAEDYLTLPECVDRIITIKLPDKARKKYDAMKKEMLLELEEGEVLAANAAAVMSKLKQMANGAVYLTMDTNDKRKFSEIHTAKLDALEDLVDELNGAPLLVAYEFNHDRERLAKRFGERIKFLGSGTTSKQAVQIEKDWNNNKIEILAVHPASVGHGLNMQKGGAGHIAWFGVTWDLELYLQLLRRLLRQGTTATRIMNHLLLVENSADFVAWQAIQMKDTGQARLLQGLIGYLHGNIETEIEDMSSLKLRRPNSAPPADDEPKPNGWGQPATSQPQTEDTGGAPMNIKSNPEDRVDPAQQIEDNVSDEQGTPSMFSTAVKDALNAPQENADGPAEQSGDGTGNDLPPEPVQREPASARPVFRGLSPEPTTGAGNGTDEQTNVRSGLSKLKKAELIEYAQKLEAELAAERQTPTDGPEPADVEPVLNEAEGPYVGSHVGSTATEAYVSVQINGTPTQVAEALKQLK